MVKPRVRQAPLMVSRHNGWCRWMPPRLWIVLFILSIVIAVREFGNLDLAYREGCAIAAAVLGLMALVSVLIVFYFRNRNQPVEVRIYRDRLEEYLNDKLVRTIRWNSILLQTNKPFDVWVHHHHVAKIGYGTLFTRRFFRFDALCGKSTRFDIEANFLPPGVLAADFANTRRLRRAFLLSLIKARPDLRLETCIYEICALHPATLGYYFRPAALIVTMVLLVVFSATGVFFGINQLLLVLAPRQPITLSIIFSIVGITLIVGLMALFARHGSVFLLNAEAPEVRRRRLLNLQSSTKDRLDVTHC